MSSSIKAKTCQSSVYGDLLNIHNMLYLLLWLCLLALWLLLQNTTNVIKYEQLAHAQIYSLVSALNVNAQICKWIPLFTATVFTSLSRETFLCVTACTVNTKWSIKYKYVAAAQSLRGLIFHVHYVMHRLTFSQGDRFGLFFWSSGLCMTKMILLAGGKIY